MKAIKIRETILINEKAVNVFDYTQDYNNRLEWDTFLKKAHLMDGATAAGKSIRAFCVAKNGLGMVTEYITFNRPKVTSVKMTKGPYLFKSFVGSWTFREVSASKTEVIFLYSFILGFPFNLLTNFIKNNLRANVKQRLVDLKKNIENKRTNT